MRTLNLVLIFLLSNTSYATEPTIPEQVVTEANCEAKVTPQREDDLIFKPFPPPSYALNMFYLPYEWETETTGTYGYLTNEVPFTIENVLHGYRHSIFPFIVDDGKMHWFSFEKRGVLDFSDFKISRSTRKFLKKNKPDYTVTMNEDFKGVIEACADSSKTINATTRGGDWIRQETIDVYVKLHEMGFAHSLEVWTQGPNGRELAGGLYGVVVDGVFFGESIFTRKEEASRFGVIMLVEFLVDKGFTWIDLQIVSETMGRMGAKEVTRDEFIQRLRKSQAEPIRVPVEKVNLGSVADYLLKNE